VWITRGIFYFGYRSFQNTNYKCRKRLLAGGSDIPVWLKLGFLNWSWQASSNGIASPNAWPPCTIVFQQPVRSDWPLFFQPFFFTPYFLGKKVRRNMKKLVSSPPFFATKKRMDNHTTYGEVSPWHVAGVFHKGVEGLIERINRIKHTKLTVALRLGRDCSSWASEARRRMASRPRSGWTFFFVIDKSKRPHFP
jgi:hypothetical protein